jgi:hypothetical protein
MLTDFRKVLDHVAIAAGFWEHVRTPRGELVKDEAGEPVKRGTVRSKMFRHTYCSARLQTLDQGRPGVDLHGRPGARSQGEDFGQVGV